MQGRTCIHSDVHLCIWMWLIKMNKEKAKRGMDIITIIKKMKNI